MQARGSKIPYSRTSMVREARFLGYSHMCKRRCWRRVCRENPERGRDGTFGV